MAQTASRTGTRSQADQSVDINEGAAQVGTGVILAAAGLVGAWGATCMASALVQFGVSGVVKGWFSAIGG